MAFVLMEKVMTLDQLPAARTASILDIASCPLAERLACMGLAPGEAVRVIRKLPWGGPIECEVIGYRLALRRSEAALVTVSTDAAA
jgi:Fe2+ transport system protein FeoA